MAIVVGTSVSDFIHRAGDFQIPPPGSNEIDTATAGDDTIRAGESADTVFADAGDDLVHGDDGNDELAGGLGVDTLNGGSGDDRLWFWWADPIEAGESIIGGIGTDTLAWIAGAGDLSGATFSGIEVLEVSGGDLLLTAAQLNSFDTITSSPWSDFAHVTLAAPGTVDLRATTVTTILTVHGSADGDVFRLPDDHDMPSSRILIDGAGGSDTMFGGEGTDYGNGGNGDDLLNGLGGNDILAGENGSDTLNGGDGNDGLTGGAGADMLNGGASGDSFVVYQNGSDISGLAETISGGAGNDVLGLIDVRGMIDISQAELVGVEGLVFDNHRTILTPDQLGAFDQITGAFPFSRDISELILAGPGTADLSGATITRVTAIRGSAGDDTIDLSGVTTAQSLYGNGGNDELSGGNRADTLIAGNGLDTLEGGGGDDSLSGEGQADMILGQGGNDELIGGHGRDWLRGGQGDDTFTFALTHDSTSILADSIMDFTSGEDVIDLALIDADATTAGDQAFSFIGTGAFSGDAGELRYDGGVLAGDIDGDEAVDFQVILTGAPLLAVSDLDL